MRDDPFVSEKMQVTALQNLFHELQRSTLPVSPSVFFEAMGWTALEVKESHDFQEVWRMILGLFQRVPTLSRIHNQVFATKFWLRSGSGARLVDSAHTVFETKRGDLMEALRYSCRKGGYEAQCPEPGHYIIVYKSLPPVLVLQAKLEDYDHASDAMKVVKNRFQFPETFDFAEVADLGEDPRQDTHYQLHGVVMLENGRPPRWMLYLRPQEDDKWLLFFNESVTLATRKEVFDDTYARGQRDASTLKPLKSASMLVYLKRSMLGELLY